MGKQQTAAQGPAPASKQRKQRKQRGRRRGGFLLPLIIVVAALGGLFLYDQTTALNYDDVVQRLRAAGATVEPGDAITSEYFSVQGRALAVNGQPLAIYAYPSTAVAMYDAVRIPPDGAGMSDSWINGYHNALYYMSGRVITIYTGDQESVAQLLFKVFGSPFACVRASDGSCALTP
jgi:hypothetical protein